ncbi:MAG TPA: hypothetical protein VLS45_00980 [Methylomicrobium sp.]|nr:hypothetical protein [Methylomicrobium sp.]
MAYLAFGWACRHGLCCHSPGEGVLPSVNTGPVDKQPFGVKNPFPGKFKLFQGIIGACGGV